MNKKHIKEKILRELVQNAIPHRPWNESGRPMKVEDVDEYHIGPLSAQVPGGFIEIMLRFREEHVYVMAYYAWPIVKEEKKIQLYEKVNYINSQFFYDTPFDHKLILDRNDELAVCTLIRYESVESILYDTMRYILEFQRYFLEKIFIEFKAVIQTEMEERGVIEECIT